MKWTSASNLLVCTQAPSPSTLTNTLKAIQSDLSDQHLIIRDIIPNTRWSCMTLSHVHTGKGAESPAHSPTTLHEELTENNPRYVALTIHQLPTWVQDPKKLKDGHPPSHLHLKNMMAHSHNSSLGPPSPLSVTSGAPSRPGSP